MLGRSSLMAAAAAAFLTIGGLSTSPAFGAKTRLSRHGDAIVSIDGDGNRKVRKIRRRFGPTGVQHYMSTCVARSRSERAAIVRKIYTDGEARRKAAWKPDDRPGKYLHSHARAMRALAGIVASRSQ